MDDLEPRFRLFEPVLHLAHRDPDLLGLPGLDIEPFPQTIALTLGELGAAQGLTGIALVAALECAFGGLLPAVGLLVVDRDLRAQPVFVGHGGGDRTFGGLEFKFHVDDELVEAALGVLQGIEHGVDPSLDEQAEPLCDLHFKLL